MVIVLKVSIKTLLAVIFVIIISFFSFNSNPSSSSISKTYFATAGADASPGDSIPPTFIKFLHFLDANIIKSPVFGVALRPVKLVIVFLKSIFFMLFLESETISFIPSLEVDISSLSSTTVAFGPTNKFP
mgnify:CR=1 FL=1